MFLQTRVLQLIQKHYTTEHYKKENNFRTISCLRKHNLLTTAQDKKESFFIEQYGMRPVREL